MSNESRYRIGCRAHDYGRQGAASLAAAIARDGFNAAQLAPAKALTGVERFEDITDAVLESAKDGFAAAGVRIEVMSCYVEIGSPEDAERKQAVDQFCAATAHAARLGAPLIATETSMFSDTDGERETRYQSLLDGAKRMAEAAERNGVTACIEPVAVHTLNSAPLARRLLDDVGSPNLKILFDPVNLLTPDNVAHQRELFDEFIYLLGPDIAAMHIKDVNLSIGWTPIGGGIVDYARIFERLGERNLPLIREEVRPEAAAADARAIREIANKQYI